MSKKSRARAKDKRQAMKRARKAAQKAQYEAWAREGKNKKSKRTRLKAGRAIASRSHSHPDGPCGNIGCGKCNPAVNDPRNAPRISCIYGKQFMPAAMVKWAA